MDRSDHDKEDEHLWWGRQLGQGQGKTSSLLSHSLIKHSVKIIKFKITFHISISLLIWPVPLLLTTPPHLTSFSCFLSHGRTVFCPTYLLHPLPLYPQSIKTQMKIGKAFHLPRNIVQYNAEIQSQLFHFVTYILPLFFCLNVRFQFYQTYSTNVLYFMPQIHLEKNDCMIKFLQKNHGPWSIFFSHCNQL